MHENAKTTKRRHLVSRKNLSPPAISPIFKQGLHLSGSHFYGVTARFRYFDEFSC